MEEQERPYTKRGQPLKEKKKKRGSGKPKMYNHTKTRKKPQPRYRSTRDYDFLQHVRVVFKWATENSELSRSEIEILLYLYPKGTFTRHEYLEFHKIIGMFQIKSFQKMLRDGWIYMWRKANPNKRENALYALSSKAKILCSKMHQFCVGEKDIPTSRRANKLNHAGGDRIDGYYMDLIKKMNKERKLSQKEIQEEDDE